MSTSRWRSRLVAVVAAVALLSAASLYAAHGYGERLHESGHCDLCLHFAGTAGSPAHVGIVGKPVLVVRVPVEPPTTLLPARHKAVAHLPRGPPESELI